MYCKISNDFFEPVELLIPFYYARFFIPIAHVIDFDGFSQSFLFFRKVFLVLRILVDR